MYIGNGSFMVLYRLNSALSHFLSDDGVFISKIKKRLNRKTIK